MEKEATAFLRLLEIMDDLREKCPWDKKQTIQSLRAMTIEETYELAEAINEEDWKNLKEELGDLLLHIVFYSKIATEQKQFTITDVLNGISEKLINRHPHIYGQIEVKDAEEVKRNWEKIKISEGKKSVLSGIPSSMPSWNKALRVQEKAKQVGFEWKNTEDVFEKVKEELKEFEEARLENNRQHLEEEFGDILFSLLNYARFLQIEPETALEKTNRKFISRFQKMEAIATEEGKSLPDLSLEEMDRIWNKIKKEK